MLVFLARKVRATKASSPRRNQPDLTLLRSVPMSSVVFRPETFSLLVAVALCCFRSTSNAQLQKECREAEQKGIDFLAASQNATGGFTTYEWRTLTPDRKRAVDTPFTVSQVLYSLSFCAANPGARAVREKAVAYLIREREEPGVWRYQGRGERVPPDVDDTALAWAALKRENNSIAPDALEAVRARRDPAGLFNTWIGDPATWSHIDSREIDPVVNLNALLFFGLAGEKIDNVCRYTLGQLEGDRFRSGSVYYPSPLAFLFALSRAYSDGGADCLKEAVSKLRSTTLALQEKDGAWGTDYETALGVLTLLNLGDKAEPVERAIRLLLSRQMPDGGWAIATAYSGADTWLGSGRFFYGSRAVTTSLCVEALAKYLRR